MDSEKRLTRTSSKVADTAQKLNRNLSQSTMRRKSRSQSMVEQNALQVDPEKVKPRKTHSSNEPGLRSMLYGLTMKMEKEEAAQKKRQKKQLGGTDATACVTKSFRISQAELT
ncbi:hypothetical protein L596_001440 [Steinernema carpocapsae]|uniref:Uncharacterized protein n=1 Tax=Steinernema carpocapsae TaxID=34508 RepID=A0A4U8UNT6_STECR|nr:hypothetical protein L596_001440 [Steinernema carpocapsae]